ncbi:hypothetical protein PV04_10130 [Phialophora macrospora]|uniref:Uncharacterized protein n=1 Tax=Phialophora macrospora TaxID=1851006 RepID=A0A0D2FT75_9EURO|nr:hypothetical protein PV04_10130 [Phialophora macrospora]
MVCAILAAGNPPLINLKSCTCQKQLLVSGARGGDQTTLRGIHNRSSRCPMVTQFLGTIIEMQNLNSNNFRNVPSQFAGNCQVAWSILSHGTLASTKPGGWSHVQQRHGNEDGGALERSGACTDHQGLVGRRVHPAMSSFPPHGTALSGSPAVCKHAQRSLMTDQGASTPP